MGNYCQAGDTARITFPDSSIREFTDTPVSIECNSNLLDCQQIDINYTFSYSWYGTTYQSSGGGKRRWKIGNGIILPNGEINNSMRIDPANPRNIQIFDKGSAFSGCQASQNWNLVHSISSPSFFTSVSNARIVNTVPGKKISIYGFSGDKLFEGIFENCDYLVECIAGCPPGTLDCGDCCLNCSSISSSLETIRNMIINL